MAPIKCPHCGALLKGLGFAEPDELEDVDELEEDEDEDDD